MKKEYFILFIFIIVTIFSCKDDIVNTGHDPHEDFIPHIISPLDNDTITLGSIIKWSPALGTNRYILSYTDSVIVPVTLYWYDSSYTVDTLCYSNVSPGKTYWWIQSVYGEYPNFYFYGDNRIITYILK